MTSKRILTALAMTLIASAVSAQKRVGDFIESASNYEDMTRAPRAVQYIPYKNAFYTVNGNNRFTRALYGSHTDYRIETSDRPVFAIYKSKNYRSLRFFLDDLQLDKAENCEAYYKEGMRQYVVRDSKWGNSAVLYIDVVAYPDKEGAIWHFRAEGFNAPVTLTSKVCNIANPKLHRNGDMGADKPGCFEPSANEDGLVTEVQTFCQNTKDTTVFADLNFQTITFTKGDDNQKMVFDNAKKYFKDLCSRIEFNTPDPFINALAGPLVLAADGVWDGETWLHGAIGWRMPLAGWRAGYLGDVLGWNDRAVSHFNAYANSQVTNVPVTLPGAHQDGKQALARAEKKWGTEMYSNGYICRNPNRNDQMHHYDMNLNYIDELLWHFEYDADTAYMRKMWPVLTRHLAWEKLNFDSDNDHLYDAYCCIWASDALYYNDGAVAHSSAYNYRGNLLASKIAEKIGEDPTPYRDEAEAILKAMNERLWLNGDEAYVPSAEDIESGKKASPIAHWAEYQDNMGLKRKHADAAVWSEYTPIDCGVGTSDQMYMAALYLDNMPSVKLEIQENSSLLSLPQAQNMVKSTFLDETWKIRSTSDWMPYAWSINNVASAEIMHTALAMFESNLNYEGYNLMKANILDQMYLGQSPANFGQINYYDAARGECYRDFGDNVGISARTLLQGFFGIIPQALDGKCIIRPGFPLEWDSVEVKTPYLSYKYKKVDANNATITVEQHFKQPLKIVARINGDYGYLDYAGNDSQKQVLKVKITDRDSEMARNVADSDIDTKSLGLVLPQTPQKLIPQKMNSSYNANVSDIFNNKYLTPRPKSTSLELPVQGVGEWCHPLLKPEINDSVFRSLAVGDQFVVEGIPFYTPQKGQNIVFTSLWDNYPSSVKVPLKAQYASVAYLLLAGSTNHMQTHIDNALVIAEYEDGASDTLHLIPPFNYCPIEQDYFVDGKAFMTCEPRPVRVCLGTGMVSRNLGESLRIKKTEVYGREIKGGAAQMLAMPLKSTKKVKSLTLTTLSNDVVVGLMAVTLGK